jgi:hypothetical protein
MGSEYATMVRDHATEPRVLDARRCALLAHDLDRTTAIPGLPQKVFVDEVPHVLVNRCDRRQFEALANLLKTRRVALALQVLADEIEDLLLPLGETHANSHGPGAGTSTRTLTLAGCGR